MANRALNRTVHLTTQRALGVALAAVLMVLSTMGLSRAMNHTARKDAAAEKPAIQAAVDSTAAFGRCVVTADGTIKSWNAGMSALTGWKSRDMVTQKADRMDPHLEGPEALTFSRVFSRREMPWVARGTVWIKHRDGHTFPITASVRDLDGGQFREINLDNATTF